MAIVFIAHPVSGDIQGNIKKILAIVRDINLNEPDVLPLASYIVDLQCLDDSIEYERRRGFHNNFAILKSGIVNELRLYGNTISSGMREEVKLCHKLGIPVRGMTIDTSRVYQELYENNIS